MYGSKCAEVFCISFENFSIECTDCHLKTDAFNEFVSHYQEIHCNIQPKIEHQNIQTQLKIVETLLVEDFPVTEPNQADGAENVSIKTENCQFEDEYELDEKLIFESDDDAPIQDLLENPLERSQNGCPVCDKTYGNRPALRAHLRKHHSEYKLPELNDCKKLKCQLCFKKNFSSKYALQNHKRVIHNCSVEGVNSIQCSVVDDVTDATNHIKSEEIVNISLNQFDQESSRSEEINIMDFHASSASDDDWQPEECEEKKSPIVFNREESSNFACLVCDKEYRHRKSLRTHVRRNHPGVKMPRLNAADKTTSCADCNGKIFSSRKALLRHRREMHGNVTIDNYQCPHCEKQFKTHNKVTSHMRFVHKIGKYDMKRYPCTQCDRVFSERYMLNRHEIRHTGIRNYTCTVADCGLAFFDAKSLGAHKKHVHIAIRKFVCDICGFSTKTASSLQQHIRTHTGERPFKCDQCDKRFTTSAAVIEHKVSHTAHIRPHVCDVCGKAFARPKALYHHKPLHLGIKKFICKICGKAYSQLAGLSAHKRSHTLDDFGEPINL